MREELGDVLLQVVFHARVAAEAAPDRRFDVDDVAGDLVDKLVRRHPHVFGDAGPARRRAGRGGLGGDQAGGEAAALADRGRLPLAAGRRLGCRAGPAGGPGRAADARRRPTSPSTARRSWGSGCWPSSRRAEQRGWDVEDALREAVRRYAGELDAAAARPRRSGLPP